MILIFLFLVSFAMILAIYHMFKVPYIPFKHETKLVAFNLFAAFVLAAMFDKGLWFAAAIVLLCRLVWEKIEQFQKQ